MEDQDDQPDIERTATAESAPRPRDVAYPPALRAAEEAIRNKRPKWKAPTAKRSEVGFGLSGGGIRSATFCLGVFQGLAKLGLLGEIDYTSSVSGGSYLGGFYGRLFTRPDVASVANDQTISPDIAKILSPNELERESFTEQQDPYKWKREAFRWLRENGRYLSPRGGGDLLLAVAVFLRNWLTIQLIMWVGGLAIFLIAQALRITVDLIKYHDVPVPPSSGYFWWSPFVAVAAIMTLLLVMPPAWAYWGFYLPEPGEGEQQPSGSHRTSLRIFLMLLPLLIAAVLLALRFSAYGSWILTAAVLFCLLTIVFWLCALKYARATAGKDSKRSSNRRDEGEGNLEDNLVVDEAARSWLSIAMRTALMAATAVLAFGLIDSVGQTVYAMAASGNLHVIRWLVGILSSLSAIAPFASWLASSLKPKNAKTRMPSISLNVAAGIAAAIVIIPVLIVIDGFSHAISYGFAIPKEAPYCLLIAHSQRKRCCPRNFAASSNQPAKDNSAGASSRPPNSPATPVARAWSRFISRWTDPQTPLAVAKCKYPPSTQLRRPRSLVFTLAGLGVAILFSLIVGLSDKRNSPAWMFLNRTSLHTIYTSRLIRAYLGASNGLRYSNGKSVSDVIPGDDLSEERYWRKPDPDYYAIGAPLHIVNSTINETVDGRSQLEQRDRKGVGLAIGPGGISAGVRHHVVYGEAGKADTIFPAPPEFRVFDYPENKYAGQPLSLGNWIGVSGAAVSTGMGFRSSLGISLLLGFFNVRLGYWWDSRIERLSSTRSSNARPVGRWIKEMFRAQTCLLDEFMGRFHGTARRRWNLSDGGNFENLGGYELIRRRLPLIIIIDGDADPDYEFADVSNLVRKARLDFNAEIKFLSPAELRARGFDDKVVECYGTLEELRRGRWAEEPVPDPKGSRNVSFKSSNIVRTSLKHAALAGVYYLDDRNSSGEPKLSSFLILIKPTLTGDEPADVLEYHNSHPSFPHESTANQFFDEAQWESYRRLGQHIVEMIFREPDKGGFLPQKP